MDAPQQEKVSISNQQIQVAAAAGLGILNDNTIRVPMGLAMGALGNLRMILQGLAEGALVVTAPAKPSLSVVESTNAEKTGA